jgi:hypothetical protein
VRVREDNHNGGLQKTGTGAQLRMFGSRWMMAAWLGEDGWRAVRRVKGMDDGAPSHLARGAQDGE